MAIARVVLASRSAQRKEILEQLDVNFRVVEPTFDEVQSGDDLTAVARANAEGKASSIVECEGLADDEVVLAADTVMSVDEGRILGKPSDRADAHRMLRLLSGRSHKVTSAIALVSALDPQSVHIAHSSAVVHFRVLQSVAIEEYVSSGESDGRAGSYAIQGRGSLLVERVEGDYYTVVGLPVQTLRRLAISAGVDLGAVWR